MCTDPSLLALVCFLFLVWTTWGVGAQIVFWGFLILLLGTPLYIWFKTRMPVAGLEEGRSVEYLPLR